jgi:hypothetical protein
LLPLALTFVVGACGGRPLPPPPDLTETEPLPSATAQDPTRAARAAFENPGGMWPPPLLAAHAEQLRKLGLELDPSALSDPMAYPLGAVVWLGGCSASFVSPQGLVITNHHCATGALQFNSTPERNMLEQGFLAKSRADERSNGPTARVYVTQSFRDVTSEVRRGIEQMGDPLARHRAIEQRIKDLVAGCEKGRAELRCNVASYFGGEQYLLIEKLELRDVRLVYARAEGVGNYGGEIDNWR